MKHSEWLRLQAEGDRVVASLRVDGFNCRKQPRCCCRSDYIKQFKHEISRNAEGAYSSALPL